jgi:hypothetical protein
MDARLAACKRFIHGSSAPCAVAQLKGGGCGDAAATRPRGHDDGAFVCIIG